MITDLQIAVRNLIAPLLAADSLLTATLQQVATPGANVTPAAGKSLYEVRTTIEVAENPGARHVIYVHAREGRAPMTILRDAIVEISVGSPADVEGITIANHALLERAVDRVWDATRNPTLAASLSAAIAARLTGWTGGGFYVEGWQEAREDKEMLPVYAIKIGVQRS